MMDILETLKELGGYWKYSGGRYLAKLTSGKVSDTFVNTGVLTCRPKPLANAVESVLHTQVGSEDIDTFAVRYFDVPNLYVCGPAMGGITLAYEVARQLGAEAIFTEPVYATYHDEFAGGFDKIFKTGQQLKRFQIPEGATVLFVEDVITMGKSTREMIEAVYRSFGPVAEGAPIDAAHNVLPYVLCLVNRSQEQRVSFTFPASGQAWPERAAKGYKAEAGCYIGRDFQILSLASIQARTWDAIEKADTELRSRGERPLHFGYCQVRRATDRLDGDDVRCNCKLEALRPKDNWNKLKGS